jgi:predicted alpha-1,2-mannosidase
MILKMNRRRFAGLSVAAAASVWARPVLGETREAAGFVNPLIGASTSQKLGEGKTFPGPTTPFGLVQLSPDTMTGGDNAPGYSYEHTTMEGFSFTHMSGVGWCGDFGNLLTMPTTGPLEFAAGRSEHPDEGWRSPFSHSTEVAQAGYYAVTLERYKIRAELSAAPHAGILRFTFPRSTESRILLDLARRIGGTSTRQYVKVVGKDAIEGWVHCTPKDGGWGNGDGQVEYTLYFRTEFSTPMDEFGVVSIDLPDGRLQGPSGLVGDYFLTDDYYARVKNGRVMRNFSEQEGRHLVFHTQFPTRENQQVLTKTGISYVSLEGARANLTQDIPDWNFEQVRRRSWSLWNQTLSCITIGGATETQHTIFNTALYHAMIDPRSVSDVDGKYVGADKKTSSSSSYSYRTIFSGWDVFRAEFPLMTILRPGVINDEINSLLELAERSGRGYLERWEIMNAYSGCMDGDPRIPPSSMPIPKASGISTLRKPMPRASRPRPAQAQRRIVRITTSISKRGTCPIKFPGRSTIFIMIGASAASPNIWERVKTRRCSVHAPTITATSTTPGSDSCAPKTAAVKGWNGMAKRLSGRDAPRAIRCSRLGLCRTIFMA